MAIKVILADDHRLFLDSLALLVQTLPGIELLGQCINGREVVHFLEKDTPDLVLSDLTMPEMSGMELILHTRQYYPKIKILVLTMLEDKKSIEQALRAGASGYVFKSASRQELEKAIHTVQMGGNYYSEGLIDKLLTPIDIPETELSKELSALTEREIEVIKLIAQEYSSQQIADQLFISLNTVETHRKNLFKKLGVKNSVGLIKFAIRHGLTKE